MEMDSIIKRFRVVTKTKYSETHTMFSAMIRKCSTEKFILKVESYQINDEDKIVCDNVGRMYFNTLEELCNEYTYHFQLCEKNLLTVYIKTII